MVEATITDDVFSELLSGPVFMDMLPVVPHHHMYLSRGPLSLWSIGQQMIIIAKLNDPLAAKNETGYCDV